MTNKQKTYLKNLVKNSNQFLIGKDGFQERQRTDFTNYILKNEVVKIKLLETSPITIDELIEILSKDNVEIVNKIGRTLVVYKENLQLKNRIIL
mgnify:CR=1 FL=1